MGSHGFTWFHVVSHGFRDAAHDGTNFTFAEVRLSVWLHDPMQSLVVT